jgi:esterase/lipase
MKKLMFLLLWLSLACTSWARNDEVGIVLLHGKWAQSSVGLAPLGNALSARGFKVVRPLMPWSEGREYDVDYPAALREIDAAIAELRKQGALRIVVGGQSLGANGALAFAGSGRAVDGIVLLAPGHVPDLGTFRQSLEPSVQKARQMVEQGRGDEKASFEDINQSRKKTVTTTARAYLSYFDPAGMGAMPLSARAIKIPAPLLIVMGTKDGLFARGEDYIFRQAPAHPKSYFATIDADHLGTQTQAIPEVLKWLETLGY